MSENENDFEALRRLLTLKQHEVPPPGYFEGFSSRVIGRIHAAEAAPKMPWLLRFLQRFERQPAYPVMLASSMCMLLLYGIVSVNQTPGVSSFAFESGQGAVAFPVAMATSQLPNASQSLALTGTTNPPASSLSDNTSLFNSQPSNPYFQSIGFTKGN
jgi:hypothetical protein